MEWRILPPYREMWGSKAKINELFLPKQKDDSVSPSNIVNVP